MVKDIKKPTHYAEDVEKCPSTNKTVHVLVADTQLRDSEDVHFILMQIHGLRKPSKEKAQEPVECHTSKPYPESLKITSKELIDFFLFKLFISFHFV